MYFKFWFPQIWRWNMACRIYYLKEKTASSLINVRLISWLPLWVSVITTNPNLSYIFALSPTQPDFSLKPSLLRSVYVHVCHNYVVNKLDSISSTCHTKTVYPYTEIVNGSKTQQNNKCPLFDWPVWSFIFCTIFSPYRRIKFLKLTLIFTNFHSFIFCIFRDIRCMQSGIGRVNFYVWSTSSFKCIWWICFSMVNSCRTDGECWTIRKRHRNNAMTQWCSYFPE